MITYLTGDILKSNAQALINPVNTMGVMGKGLALQFKKIFTENYKAYINACKNKNIDIGKLFVFREKINNEEKIIINFPTKNDWRNPSQYEYIEKGLDNLVEIIREHKIGSIAIPMLGCGLGGLDWEKVKKIINQKLSILDNVNIYIYENFSDTKGGQK